MKKMYLAFVLLAIGIISSAQAIATVSDLNGTVKMNNDYSNGQFHTTIGNKFHMKGNVSGNVGNMSGHMGMNVSGNASGSIGNMSGNASINASMNTSSNTNMTVRPPKIKRPTMVCAQYIRNVTRARMLSRREFRMRIGKDLDKIRAEIILAGMNATINKTIEYGANATKLNDLKNEFVSVLDEMNASTGKEYIQNARLLMQITVQFRKEAHSIPELEKNASDVMSAVTSAMKAEREKMKGEFDKEMGMAKEIGLAVFDLHICLAQEKLNRFYNMGFNVTSAQQILDEIKDMRSQLESAYDSGNKTEVVRIKVEIAHKWGEFHRAFIKVNAKIIRYQYMRAKRKLIKAIEILKRHGRDVSPINRKIQALDEMKDRLSNQTDMEEFARNFTNLNNEIKTKMEMSINARGEKR